MKIVILGSQGQVGGELCPALAHLGEVVAFDRRGCDLASPGRAAAVIAEHRPAVVVNAAAYTKVDKAEQEPDLARRINADAVAEIAASVRALGAFLVHYSTDYVFDGNQREPYREDDRTAPLGVYGRTKLAGEEAVTTSGCRNVVFRTSWVHAARGANFIRTILRLAAERDTVRVVDDQFGAPTGAPLIAAVTARAIERFGAGSAATPGLVHLAAAGAASWCDVAREALAEAARRGARLRVSAESVVPIGSADYPTAARRPANSRLDTERLRTVLGLALPPW
ncbi:MAG: dTDP-4-dehydrorhamnose reductase, partial [Planctomycetota bacterium]